MVSYCSHLLINDTNRGYRLINHAFHHILKHKANTHSYKSLLVYLDFEIGRPKYRRYQRKFKSLVREGQATFTLFVTWNLLPFARDIFSKHDIDKTVAQFPEL